MSNVRFMAMLPVTYAPTLLEVVEEAASYQQEKTNDY